MADDSTAHLGLPLPHPDNLLSEDVQRLRAALSGVDAAFAQQTAAVDQALAASETRVDQALATTATALTRQVRLMRLNDLLGLGL